MKIARKKKCNENEKDQIMEELNYSLCIIVNNLKPNVIEGLMICRHMLADPIGNAMCLSILNSD